MAVGIARYFSSVEPTSVVYAKAALLEAADQFEALLDGRGRDSQLAQYFDDPDVAGLRSTAGWVVAGAKLIGTDFYELFGIATSGNCAPSPRQSDVQIYEEFRTRVEAFMREHAVRT